MAQCTHSQNPQAVHHLQHDNTISSSVHKRERGPIQTPVVNWNFPTFYT